MIQMGIVPTCWTSSSYLKIINFMDIVSKLNMVQLCIQGKSI